MTVVRISVSDLDSFRRWRDDEGDDDREAMTVEALLRQLKRIDPPTEEMMAGTALHDLLERAEPGNYGRLETGGFAFEFDCDFDLALPPLREAKYVQRRVISGVSVDLVGKLDGQVGPEVWDYKTTGRWDAEKFADTYQWRNYLDITGADVFRWIVFVMAFRQRRNAYVISAVHELRQYRYPAMRDDCDALIADYLHFCRLHWPEKLA